MDDIVLGSYYGDVILVSGKCWSYVGPTLSAQTGHSSPLSAYSTCSGCIAGNSPLDPPSGVSLGMGDMHYIYGIPSTIASTPTLASFNVDDNSSGNEIVWWTHTEGSTEYVIKYTQQPFDFTSGGWSINQVIVSASDGSVDDTYTLADPQDSSRRNGSSWLNGGVSGLGEAISYNITERIIPQEECPAIIGPSSHFGLFNLQVSPSTGFYSAPDEFGGALWYVWKQLGTAYGAGAVNNPSTANYDGIGAFLSGINGYNSRSQFEATPSTVREAFDMESASAVITKLDELAGINGLWVADWDPLVNDPIAECIDTYHFRVEQTTTTYFNNGSGFNYLLDSSTQVHCMNNISSSGSDARFTSSFIRYDGQGGGGFVQYQFSFLRVSNDMYGIFQGTLSDIANATPIGGGSFFDHEATQSYLASKGFTVDQSLFTRVYVRRESQGEDPWICFVPNDTYHIRAVTAPFTINSPQEGLIELLTTQTNIFNNVTGSQLTKMTLSLDTGGPFQHTVQISGPDENLDVRVEAGQNDPYINADTESEVSFDATVDVQGNTFNTIFYIRRASQGDAPW